MSLVVMRRGFSVLAVAAALALGAVASAGAAAVGQPPMLLPAGDAAAAGSAGWIVGAQRGALSTTIAARFGARPIPGLPAFTVASGKARALAGALSARQLLRFAEPDIKLQRRSAYEGELDLWARVAVVPADLAWPAPGNVKVAVIDDRVDSSVSDLNQQTKWLNQGSVADSHGTEVASTISAVIGRGPIVGVFPQLPILSFGLTSFSCSEVATGIDAAVAAGARVINMSLGTTENCFVMYAAIQRAYAKNVLSVVAAGNEFADGNPTEYPAAFPHVVSVAATDQRGHVSEFSNSNNAVDVSAPGVDVPVDVPLRFDTEDDAVDGATTASGTSFSSPITAGAAAWVAAARPTLTIAQVADLLRKSARDVAPKGYDRNTGFGIVDIKAALALAAPKIDAQEPNDAVSLVNGKALGTSAPFIWQGGANSSLIAQIDQIKDPVDIYRILIPAQSAARIYLTPNFGGADLAVYGSRATSVSGSRYRLGLSKRGGKLVDSLRISNRAAAPLSAYVVVTDKDSTLLNADYRLRIARSAGR